MIRRMSTLWRTLGSMKGGRMGPLLGCGSLILAGCGGSLTLTRVNSEADAPNNVWVFFTVEDGDEPVGGLKAEDFEIYEDGKLVSTYESQQKILNPEVAAVMYTLLLLDVSGSITESGQIDPLVDAAASFSERVGESQKVGVYAFDGEERIHSVVPFTENEGSIKGGLDGLRSYKAKDPSTNLHGAVVQGLQELKTALEREDKPLKFGTLVVFSDGADRAARVSREDMKEELKKSDYRDYDMFAIGIGEEKELEEANLKDVGRDGTVEGGDRTKVNESFDQIADQIEAHSKRFYLLSYCTPSRAGEHEVTIKVAQEDPKRSGKLEYGFSAQGFGPPPACDPERAPSFKLDDVDSPQKDGKPPAAKAHAKAGAHSP